MAAAVSSRDAIRTSSLSTLRSLNLPKIQMESYCMLSELWSVMQMQDVLLRIVHSSAQPRPFYTANQPLGVWLTSENFCYLIKSYQRLYAWGETQVEG